MSLFRTFQYPQEPNFGSLFRLLDDFENYSREAESNNNGGGGNGTVAGRGKSGRGSFVRSFSPRFDVRETDAAYELHGELPGIERENVHLEFTDPQTLVVRGRVERSYTSGNPPSAGAIEGGDGQQQQSKTSHRVTVEDENAEKSSNGNANAKASEDNSKAIEKRDDDSTKAVGQPNEKIWVSERSVGEFSRVFTFPTRVEHEGVTANLKNGVLHVVVPKAKKYEGRQIQIN